MCPIRGLAEYLFRALAMAGMDTPASVLAATDIGDLGEGSRQRLGRLRSMKPARDRPVNEIPRHLAGRTRSVSDGVLRKDEAMARG